MRWIVSLSSALALGLSVSAQADQPLPTHSSVVRSQVAAANRTAPQSVRHQATPGNVSVAMLDGTTIAPVPETPSTATAVQYTPVYSQPQYQPVRRQSGGPFSRIMELERRKNAWLRSMFR